MWVSKKFAVACLSFSKPVRYRSCLKSDVFCRDWPWFVVKFSLYVWNQCLAGGKDNCLTKDFYIQLRTQRTRLTLLTALNCRCREDLRALAQLTSSWFSRPAVKVALPINSLNNKFEHFTCKNNMLKVFKKGSWLHVKHFIPRNQVLWCHPLRKFASTWVQESSLYKTRFWKVALFNFRARFHRIRVGGRTTFRQINGTLDWATEKKMPTVISRLYRLIHY